MSYRPKGYRGYNGRGSKGKIVLAVLLCMIILAAVVFWALQSHVYYDADGKPHFRGPERPAQEQPLSPGDVELIFGEGDPSDEPVETAPAVTSYASAFSITEGTMAKGAEAINTAWMDGILRHHAAAITLKDADGKVWFDAQAAIPGSVAATAAVAAAVREAAGSDVYTVARMNTLHDPLIAKQWVTDMGLRNRSGYIFYDGNNSQWLDANKPRTRQKICEMAAEAAGMGFDEILLTGFAYPTEGNLEQVNDGGVDHAETLETLLQEIRGALPEGVALSLELPAETIQNGGNETAGHRLSSLVPLVDAIYSVTTEAEAPALRQAVTAISGDCGFIPELTGPGSAESAYLLLS